MADIHHDYDALPTDKCAPSMRQEIRVVVAVVLFVISMEIVARIMAPNIDSDREHIHMFPEIIAESAKEAEREELPNVIFFGNSLMRAGLDEKLVSDCLRKTEGPRIVSAKITPVGTAMLDWVYLYQRYFENTNQHPEILVVGFVAHHIHDQEPIKLRRLSRHFLAINDFPEIWSRDLHDFHSIIQSTLCHFSALEGDQPEHQLKILSGVVSDYNKGLNTNNDIIRAAGQRAALKSNMETKEQTFSRMQRLIKICKKHGVEIWFVPMPQPEKWNLHPDAVALIERNEMKLLDARQIKGMTADDFWDGYHLGERGKKKFSYWMAEQIKNSKP